MRKWRYSSTLLDIGIRWKLRAPSALNPRREPAVPVDRLGGSQIKSGRWGVKINMLLLPGIELRPFSLLPVTHYTDCDTHADTRVCVWVCVSMWVCVWVSEWVWACACECACACVRVCVCVERERERERGLHTHTKCLVLVNCKLRAYSFSGYHSNEL
jgi:hypothetical protein